MLQRGRDVVVHELHLAADQRHGGRADAAIGDVQELDAGLQREELETEMAEIADAARREAESARLFLGARDQSGDVLEAGRGIRDQHRGIADHHGDRNEVAQRLIGELVVERGIGDDRPVRDGGNGVAVRIRLHQRLQADGAVGAAPVLDIDLLPEAVGEMLRCQPRDEISAAARRKRADHADRALRPSLRKRGGRQRAGEQHCCRQTSSQASS